MQIDVNAEVVGTKLLLIRELFRRAGLQSTVSVDFIREELKLSRPMAKSLAQALVRAGFLKRKRVSNDWELTPEGIRLRAGTAAKPLRRSTADSLLENLLERIELLNGDPHFLARVEKAVVFGSYLSGAERLGDVDVAIRLIHREPDHEKHSEANSRRVAEEYRNGRRFSNIVEQLFWWNREAMLFLRNRKRGLSLHDYGSTKEILAATPHRVIFSHVD
jgi:predicted nucleotidyltransferase